MSFSHGNSFEEIVKSNFGDVAGCSTSPATSTLTSPTLTLPLDVTFFPVFPATCSVAFSLPDGGSALLPCSFAICRYG